VSSSTPDPTSTNNGRSDAQGVTVTIRCRRAHRPQREPHLVAGLTARDTGAVLSVQVRLDACCSALRCCCWYGAAGRTADRTVPPALNG
jgi:hypothetical protein